MEIPIIGNAIPTIKLAKTAPIAGVINIKNSQPKMRGELDNLIHRISYTNIPP
jgi:hypothetical protein